jgi:hypothetical protein
VARRSALAALHPQRRHPSDAGHRDAKPDREGLAAHWSRILETPLTRVGADPARVFEVGTICFVEGKTECLGAIRVEVSDKAATLDRAVACGYRVEDDSFHLGGVYFRVLDQTPTLETRSS